MTAGKWRSENLNDNVVGNAVNQFTSFSSRGELNEVSGVAAQLYMYI